MDRTFGNVQCSAAIVLALGTARCFGTKVDDTWDPPTTGGRDTVTRWRVTDDSTGELRGEGCATTRPMDIHANPGDVVTLTTSVEQVTLPLHPDLQHCDSPCNCPPPYGLVEHEPDPAVPDPACWTPEHSENGLCVEADFHAVEIMSTQRIPSNATGSQPCVFSGTGYRINMVIRATSPACFGTNGRGYKQWFLIYPR